MNRLPPLVAVFGLALGLSGCALQPVHRPHDRGAFVGNALEFDAYATRRADDLIRMGATKDRSAAEAQARIDAERRYGPRNPDYAAISSSTKPLEKRDPTATEIEDALGKNAPPGP